MTTVSRNASLDSSNQIASGRTCGPETHQKRNSSLQFDCVDLNDVDPEKWDALAVQSDTQNNFYVRQVVLSALRTWPELGPVQLIVGYRDAELVCLQPVRIVENRIGRMLEFLEIPTADLIEPLVIPLEKDEILDSLGEYLCTSISPDYIAGRSLTSGFAARLSGWFPDTKQHKEYGGKGWLLKLTTSSSDLLNEYSSNFRYQIKQRSRKAEQAGFEFRVVSTSESLSTNEVSDALARLRDLHGRRFASLGRPSFFLQADFREFHDQLISLVGDAKFCLTFTEALHHGKVIGSLYGLRTEATFTFLMIGFDPNYSSFSPGHLLIYHTVDDLIRHNIRTFDFKCGEESYKERWGHDHYEKFDLDIELSWSGRILRWVIPSSRYLISCRKKYRANGMYKVG